MAERRIEHPNRDKAESKATKAIVFLLMLATAGLTLVVTVGGWAVLQGAQPVAFFYILLYLVMAFYVLRWNRGVLPLAAALSILLAVVAAVSAQGWFDRDKPGFEEATIPASLLGLLTIIIVPVSVLLVAFAMRGFAQKWNVEVEHEADDEHDAYGSGRNPEPAGA
jgi:lysylphosphatidylglycerol synthetase-like protein (DUF2156 family)